MDLSNVAVLHLANDVAVAMMIMLLIIIYVHSIIGYLVGIDIYPEVLGCLLSLHWYVCTTSILWVVIGRVVHHEFPERPVYVFMIGHYNWILMYFFMGWRMINIFPEYPEDAYQHDLIERVIHVTIYGYLIFLIILNLYDRVFVPYYHSVLKNAGGVEDRRGYYHEILI